MDGKIDGIVGFTTSCNGLVVVQTLPNGGLALFSAGDLDVSQSYGGECKLGTDFELKSCLNRLQVRASCSKGRGSE